MEMTGAPEFQFYSPEDLELLYGVFESIYAMLDINKLIDEQSRGILRLHLAKVLLTAFSTGITDPPSLMCSAIKVIRPNLDRKNPLSSHF